MNVKTLMTNEIATCTTDASASDAARIMRERDCGIVPVTGSGGALRGVVTDRDICLAAYASGKKLDELPVTEAMSADVAAVRETESADAVHDIMRRRRVRRLPVVDGDEHVVGMVSLNDLSLACALASGDQAVRQERAVASTLARISEHTPEASASGPTA